MLYPVRYQLIVRFDPTARRGFADREIYEGTCLVSALDAYEWARGILAGLDDVTAWRLLAVDPRHAFPREIADSSGRFVRSNSAREGVGS
jgi:hypothetical protein